MSTYKDDARLRRSTVDRQGDREQALSRTLENSKTYSDQMTLGWGAGAMGLTKAAEPPDPVAGQSVMWLSDGSYGSEGDVVIKKNVNGTISYITLNKGIDISDGTNLAAGTNITLSGDTLNVDDAFLKNDASDETSGTITAAGFTTTGTWTFDEYTSGTIGITTVQDSGTSFNDNDTSLMTAAAIADKIEAYSYSTTTGTVTSVAIGGNDGIDVDSGSPLTGSGTIQLGLSNIANDKLANSTVTVGSTSIALGATSTAVDGLVALTLLGSGGTAIDHTNAIDGLNSDAAPLVIKGQAGQPNLTVEASGRLTTNSGIRALGNSFILGPKGATVNFIANQGASTLLNGGISDGSTTVNVDSTNGFHADDKVIFSVADSDSTSSANQSSELEIESVDTLSRFTLKSAAWSGGSQPSWAADDAWVDTLGTDTLTFRNANVNQSGSADLQFDYAAPSLGKSGGSLKFRTYNRRPATGGTHPSTNVDRLEMDSSGNLTFNPGALDQNFLVKSDDDTAMFFVDGGADKVGISVSSGLRHGFDCRTTRGYSLIKRTSNYTLENTIAKAYSIILCDTSGGTVEITLPADSSSNKGRVYEVHRVGTNAATVTVPSGTYLNGIEGGTLTIGTTYHGVRIVGLDQSNHDWLAQTLPAASVS